MYADVMKIDGHKSLISVCTPLQLLPCTGVKDESEHVLGMALQIQLQSLRERGFMPRVVCVDLNTLFAGE